MNKLFGLAAFAIGVATGVAATWQYFKKKYEAKADEDIASAKEGLKRLYNQKLEADDKKNINPADDFPKPNRKPEHFNEKPNINDYAKVLGNTGYTDYSKNEPEKKEEEKETYKPPYVISPDEFGMDDDYQRISLMYYADHILADDDDELVEDIEATVGIESLTHFGEYDDDCVYVRNERLMVDYEILRSLKTYSEVMEQKPYLRRHF